MCEHFGRCGGCTFLDISYEEELAVKEAAVKEVLGQYGDLVEGIVQSTKPSEYRNKMELAFGDEGKDGLLALGMRKKRSFYEVATPTDCVLIPDDFKKIIAYVLEYFRGLGETFFHRKRHVGALRHLVLRRGEFTGEVLVNLSTASALESPLEPLINGLSELELKGEFVGFLHSVNDGVADAVKNENVSLLWGRDYFYEKINGLTFKVSAFAFFQTNSAGAGVLYELVKEYAGAGDAAYDLYCGIGTIAQIISPLFKNVMGIEIVEDAILAAKQNAEKNGITNCEFHAGDVMAVLNAVENMSPEVVIVDPPRDGLHPKALPQIAALNAPKLVYVACKPKSLARDLVLLESLGYKPVKINAVDMFPRTPHVECVCLCIQNFV